MIIIHVPLRSALGIEESFLHDLRLDPRSVGRAGPGHTMGWVRLVGVCAMAMLLSACGALGGAPATVAPVAAPTGVPATSAPPSPTRAQVAATASPVPAAQPTATSAPAAADTVWVGNTDGEGVFVRNSPVMADRAKAYADGTPLTIVGDDVDGDGQHWKHIKTPDGLEGYVPSIYTVSTPP